jgi:hypothetical protein
MAYVELPTYTDCSLKLHAVQRVIRQLRWKDLETLALELDEWRRGGIEVASSRRGLTAQHLMDWATESEHLP